MARIHNNPKASEGQRMPLILPKWAENDLLKSFIAQEDKGPKPWFSDLTSYKE